MIINDISTHAYIKKILSYSMFWLQSVERRPRSLFLCALRRAPSYYAQEWSGYPQQANFNSAWTYCKNWKLELSRSQLLLLDAAQACRLSQSECPEPRNFPAKEVVSICFSSSILWWSRWRTSRGFVPIVLVPCHKLCKPKAAACC